MFIASLSVFLGGGGLNFGGGMAEGCFLYSTQTARVVRSLKHGGKKPTTKDAVKVLASEVIVVCF